MANPPIPVLLVQDLAVDLEILVRMLTSSAEVKIVGTARNGKEALALIPKVQPAIVCTDMHMKEMDGLELTKQVMARHARPILVISASVQKEDTHNISQLLAAGALDVLPKPKAGLTLDYERTQQELINKIKILAGVKVFTKRQQHHTRIGAQISASKEAKSFSHLSTTKQLINVTTSIRVVTIGASTGGPQALHTILTQLPADFSVPIICTQHISEGFLQGFIDWLAPACKLLVKVAQVGEQPLPGTIYFAPEKTHLALDSQGKFTYLRSLPVDGHCPSVTVTFKAVADFYGKATVGVLLTGMGRDGAEGMRVIAQAGGITIAQDEKSSVVFGMPMEAIALGAVQYILPTHEIAPLLIKKVY